MKKKLIIAAAAAGVVAAAVAALQVASSLTLGNIVVIFPDAGYKYLSDRPLWVGE